MKLGQKIRKYRIDKSISQLDLELEIDTSPGRISKIENGKINPDKETIVKIAYALKLDTPEIASLFGIEIPNTTTVFDSVNKILLAKTQGEVIDKTVNELVFKLGFIASAFFVVEGDKIFMRGLTATSIAEKALVILSQPLDSLHMSLSKDVHNLTVKTIVENSENLTNYTRDYCSPLVDTITADKIQKATGDKSVIIYPLIVKEYRLGAIAYAKKIRSNFHKERSMLKIVSSQIAIALYNSSP